MSRIKALSAIALITFTSAGLDSDVSGLPNHKCLPDPGKESHTRLSHDTSIVWHSNRTDKVNFAGGIEILVLPSSEDQRSRDVSILGFREDAEPNEQEHFTLELSGTDSSSMSTLKCTGMKSPKLILTYVLDITFTARNLDGEEGRLRTKDPAVQSVELDQWPPKGETFKLEGPIEFLFPNGSHAAMIDRYPTREHGDDPVARKRMP